MCGCKSLFPFRRLRDRIWWALLPWSMCWWRHPISWLRHGRPYGDPLFWQFWLWKREALSERKRSDYWMDKHDVLYREKVLAPMVEADEREHVARREAGEWPYA